MKTKNLRKLHRAIIANKALHHKESVRITDARGKVEANYDYMMKYKNITRLGGILQLRNIS